MILIYFVYVCFYFIPMFEFKIKHNPQNLRACAFEEISCERLHDAVPGLLLEHFIALTLPSLQAAYKGFMC